VILQLRQEFYERSAHTHPATAAAAAAPAAFACTAGATNCSSVLLLSLLLTVAASYM
jgi:hypothetical protein